jgi:hypothetical protein
MERPDPASDNRHLPRIRSEREVSLSAKPAAAGQVGGQLTLSGYTRDLSEGGMSVVAPSFNCAHMEIFGEGRELDVSLWLSTHTVVARAVAVRAAPLNEREPGEGCLLGLSITGMNEADRRRYAEFLSRGAKS